VSRNRLLSILLLGATIAATSTTRASLYLSAAPAENFTPAAKFLSAALPATGAVPSPAAKHKKKSRSTQPPPLHGPLPAQIATILADPPLAGSFWGISVTQLDGTPIFALNDDKRFAAASSTKLLTTAAAFTLLGPRFTTTTRVFAPAGVAAGTVHGDLILYGMGDTSMSARSLPYNGHTERNGDPLSAYDDLAQQIAAAGVRQVDGNITGDDTYFPWQPWPNGWAWNDLQWEYGAPVSALITNDNVVYLTITPGAAPGDPATYTWLPQIDYFTLQSSIRTVAAGPGVKTTLGAERDPGSNTVRLWGTIPVNAQPSSLALAANDPAILAAEALRERLLTHGVRVLGTTAARHRDNSEVDPNDTTNPNAGDNISDFPVTNSNDASIGNDASFNNEVSFRPEIPAPAGIAAEKTAAAIELAPAPTSAFIPGQATPPPPTGTLLAQRTSPPLLQDLTVTNKVSQNLHAEVTLLQLAANTGNLLSRKDALATERRFLLSTGMLPADFLVYDGSGLSRDDMITPRAFTALLRFAARQSWGAAYRATLPVSGTDGTLNARLNTPDLKGRVSAKTGSLSEDSALTGYLTAASGKTIVFSILSNRHLPGSAARTAIDRIIAAIVATN
jgi:D-alanyl-D-alanine carboxypeptidase/D-alanyl-D-alanine-endopeptidase (penicillin-binding protein 4)